MKKLIQKIKDYFNAKDLDKYDDLPLEEQYYRMRIENIKSSERISRCSLFLVTIIAIIFAVALIFAGVSGELDSEVTASAAEETQATDVVYRNYEISLNSAPLHFLVPYSNYQTLNPSVSTYFVQDVLDYQFNGNSSQVQYAATMYFAYQVTDNLGNIYYEGVGQAGGLLDTYINANGQYSISSNSIQGVTFSGAVTNWYALSTGERVFYPVTTTNSSYPFKIYISSENAIDISTFKLRSCALHDLKVYGADDERIWADYNFVVGSSTTHRDLSVIDAQITESSLPLYPVEQSPDVIYDLGYNNGFSYGYDEGLNDGYDKGLDDGSSTAYDEGFDRGYERGKIYGAANASDYSFLSLVSAVFDAPVAIIAGSMEDTNGDGIADTRVGGLLNFDFLGINVSSFLLAIFTICVIIALVKMFLSR